MKTGELALAYIDLKVARTLFSPYRNKGKELEPFMGNVILFHSVQAIEKMMKGIIVEQGIRDYRYTHNIDGMQTDLYQLNPSFFEDHSFLLENGAALSDVNSIRYGSRSVAPSIILPTLKEASKMFEEQLAIWSKQHGGADFEQFLEAARAYETKLLPFYMIQDGRQIGGPAANSVFSAVEKDDEER